MAIGSRLRRMTPFAQLLGALVFAPGRLDKIRLIQRYLDVTPDPDRGYALAAIAGEISLKAIKPSLVRGLAEDRVDPVLFRLSHDFVGDLAETVSLIWPEPATKEIAPPPSLAEIVDRLQAATRLDAPALMARLLDRLGPDERFALIKLATGGLRVGVSARLARQALSEWAAQNSVDATVAEIEELWHGLEPPYDSLFAWLSGAAGVPQIDLSRAFRPMMLANPLDSALYSAAEMRADSESDEETLARLSSRLTPTDFVAEWKWDGIRVQLAADGGRARLYTRTGEDISAAFPDLVEAMRVDGVLDGELLIVRDGAVQPFSDLQRRLGRKSVTTKMLRELPAHLRAYDILFDAGEDLRTRPFEERRSRLEAFGANALVAGVRRLDISERVPFERWADLMAIRAGARAASHEGLMLKRRDSVYQSGRPMGPWFKWKRGPLSADLVLIRAQRGHGRRSSFYSDYTFGAWRDGENGPELAPVAKAYSGYTDGELKRLDKWVRANIVERFGPVRAVTPEIVFEIAFDSVQRSTRHRSGIALRFPRIKRIRWDKPTAEADKLETLERMIVDPEVVETDFTLSS